MTNWPNEEFEAVLSAAAAAAPVLAVATPAARAAALVAAGDALDAVADELVTIAMGETGLGEPRLRGELRRTSVQLRLFAEVVAEGAYLDVRIDDADPDFVLGPRPSLRRYLAPIGPVLNFAASNFPFAFSVMGGDTAAALAAGNPVVVKGHEGHPELSRRTAEVAAAALSAAGMPDGTLGLVLGRESGVRALEDPRIKAAAFTGSTQAGQYLASIAAARPVPIPFFGELGSVNPVFVTRAAAATRLEEIVAGFAASVSGSAGQLCTKPGFMFVPRGVDLEAPLTSEARGVPEQRLLYPGIASGFAARRDAILTSDGVVTIREGASRTDDAGESWVTPTFVRTDVATLRRRGEAILDEAFGPLAIVVDYDDPAELPGLVEEFFAGNLTGTIHLGTAEQAEDHAPLVAQLAAHSGRVLFDGWPTGVSVTPAMTHGGPFPATVGFGGTSVGTASIARFLRPVTYQNAPEAVLPPSLREDNPWKVPQQRALAGESSDWGSLHARAVEGEQR